MKRTERMCKTRMFRRLICKISETKLSNAAKALKFRRVDQGNEQTPLVRVGIDADDIMYRIAIDPFRQACSKLRRKCRLIDDSIVLYRDGIIKIGRLSGIKQVPEFLFLGFHIMRGWLGRFDLDRDTLNNLQAREFESGEFFGIV